jgi:hypothetical protein
LLLVAQMAYNSTASETTKLLPFYANYRFEPDLEKLLVITRTDSDQGRVKASEILRI